VRSPIFGLPKNHRPTRSCVRGRLQFNMHSISNETLRFR
jgi:hypothetical protein